jgi:hypothetical protein
MLPCLVLVGACERQGQPDLWRAPKVGDRGSASFSFTANIEGPDGRTHTIANRNNFNSELLALDGEFPTKIRMTIALNEGGMDGAVKPGVSGAFEVTHTGDALDVIHVGGAPLTPEERAYFKSANPPTRITTAASKRFLLQPFKVGQTLTLTHDEIIGLGFGMSSVELTVTEVTPARVVFTMKSVAELSGLGSTMQSTGTLRLSSSGRELAQDGEVLREGTHVGTVHVELHSRSL